MRQTDKSLQSEKFKQVVGGLGKPLGKSPAPDRTQSPRDLDRSFPCWPGSGYFGTAPGGVLSTAKGPRPFQLWDPRPPHGAVRIGAAGGVGAALASEGSGAASAAATAAAADSLAGRGAAASATAHLAAAKPTSRHVLGTAAVAADVFAAAAAVATTAATPGEPAELVVATAAAEAISAGGGAAASTAAPSATALPPPRHVSTLWREG